MTSRGTSSQTSHPVAMKVARYRGVETIEAFTFIEDVVELDIIAGVKVFHWSNIDAVMRKAAEDFEPPIIALAQRRRHVSGREKDTNTNKKQTFTHTHLPRSLIGPGL